jgi:cob(I)alamin adenosyltransferase
MAMKIYTKTGDKGTTALIGGKRVSKAHARLEAYGSVDELIAYVGLIRDQAIDLNYKQMLITVQDKLMVCASELATDEDYSGKRLPLINDNDLLFLENAMDAMEATLPPLSHFVLPGGHTTVSFCHIARTVCRRAERQAIRLNDEHAVDPMVLRYINRLSDFFFMLSRKLTQDLNAEEIFWTPHL